MEIRHIGIVCRDIEESLRFYRDLLGFSISSRQSESGTFISTILSYKNLQVETIKVSLPEGKVQIELLSFTNPPMHIHGSLFSNGITHIALRVNNLGKLFKELKSHGIEFLSDPEVSKEGYARVCFCKDPNGVFLELVEIL